PPAESVRWPMPLPCSTPGPPASAPPPASKSSPNSPLSPPPRLPPPNQRRASGSEGHGFSRAVQRAYFEESVSLFAKRSRKRNHVRGLRLASAHSLRL